MTPRSSDPLSHAPLAGRAVAPLDTDRLTLTQPSRDDLPDWLAMHRDERVMATLGGVRPDDALAAALDRHIAHWQTHGFGWWIARRRDTGAFVGRGGLRVVIVEGVPAVEVGYGFVVDAWGQGYATELTRAAIRVAFDLLGLRGLVCFTLPENTPSRRVMEKCGFVFERDIVYADFEHVLYALKSHAD